MKTDFESEKNNQHTEISLLTRMIFLSSLFPRMDEIEHETFSLLFLSPSFSLTLIDALDTLLVSSFSYPDLLSSVHLVLGLL